MGAKTARRLYEELGVDVEDLKAAAEAQAVRELKGLGPKVEENVLASWSPSASRRGPGRLLLSKVRPIAEELAAALREHPAANRVEVAGSARRWGETCKDIDLIATAEEPAALAEHLADHPLIAAAGTPGPNGVRAQTHNGISVDLRIVLRPPSATCCSTSPAPRPTTCSCAKRRSRAASRSPSTGSPRPRAARSSSARPRRPSTSGSATTTSSRSCARAAAS